MSCLLQIVKLCDSVDSAEGETFKVKVTLAVCSLKHESHSEILY